jgi:hypothetical protein
VQFEIMEQTHTHRLSSVNGLFPDGDASHGPIGASLLGCGRTQTAGEVP